MALKGRALLWQVSDASLAQMPEFRQRVDVLRRMQYLAEDDTVQLKVPSLGPFFGLRTQLRRWTLRSSETLFRA